MKLSGNRPDKRERKKTAGGRIALIVILAVLAMILGGAAVGMTYVNRIDTVFPGVTLDQMDLSGMELGEVVTLLEQKGYSDLGEAALAVELPLDITMNIRADEVCAETPVLDIAMQAYNACKGGSAIEDAITYLRCRIWGMQLQSETVLTVDEAAVLAKAENAAKEVSLALMGSDLQIMIR